MEHNTGKSQQKCYSRINDGMDKLTEDKVKYVRARLLLTQCPVLLIHSPTLIAHSIPLKHNYSIGVIQILQSIKILKLLSYISCNFMGGQQGPCTYNHAAVSIVLF